MADSDQDNPPAGKSPAGEGVGRAADHTSDQAEAKARDLAEKADKAERAAARVFLDLTNKLRKTSELLEEKERLMISYVIDRFPKPFYTSWRDDSNLVLSQVIGMRRRQRKVAARLSRKR